MNLLQRIRNKFKKPTPLFDEAQGKALQESVKQLTQSKGRVVKGTRSAEFHPDMQRHGGRVVKTMPRSLQKIKQAQEKVEDDAVA